MDFEKATFTQINDYRNSWKRKAFIIVCRPHKLIDGFNWCKINLEEYQYIISGQLFYFQYEDDASEFLEYFGVINED